MGKFDRVLDGEKKLRGVKRKVRTVPPFSSFMRAHVAAAPSSTRRKIRRRGEEREYALLKQIGNGGSSRKTRNGKLPAGMVRARGMWSMCARRCDSLLDASEYMRSRVRRVWMAHKSGRQDGREGLFL
jgi:hypothetical protein